MSVIVEKKKQIKLGYEAPKGLRVNSNFMYIEVKDMHYCYSHDFWFNKEEQDRLLHTGKPCFYTDGYVEGNHNSYGEGCMIWNRRGGFTLKKAFRLLKRTRNLPVGTIVEIGHNCVGKHKKSKKAYGLGYKFKVKKENKFDPQYEVMRPSFFENFNTDQKSKDLTNLLRANGFLVSVNNKNPNFISGMIATASAAIGKSADVSDEGGEIAVAYGHGLRVGFSSNKSSYRGYSNGCENVLFDKWDEFNKWSQCYQISKEKTNEEILEILLNVKNEVRDCGVNDY